MSQFKHFLIAVTLFVWPSASFASSIRCPQGTREVKDFRKYDHYLGIQDEESRVKFQKCRRLTWGEYNPDNHKYVKAEEASDFVRCGDITIEASRRKDGDPVEAGIDVVAKSGGTAMFYLWNERVYEKDGGGGSEDLFIAQCATPGAEKLLTSYKLTFRGYHSSLDIASNVSFQNKCTAVKQSGDKYFKQTYSKH